MRKFEADVYVGPFKIIKDAVHGHNATIVLKLPSHVKINPTVNVRHCKPFIPRPAYLQTDVHDDLGITHLQVKVTTIREVTIDQDEMAVHFLLYLVDVQYPNQGPKRQESWTLKRMVLSMGWAFVNDYHIQHATRLKNVLKYRLGTLLVNTFDWPSHAVYGRIGGWDARDESNTYWVTYDNGAADWISEQRLDCLMQTPTTPAPGHSTRAVMVCIDFAGLDPSTSERIPASHEFVACFG